MGRPTADELWKKLPEDLREQILEVFDLGVPAAVKRLFYETYRRGIDHRPLITPVEER